MAIFRPLIAALAVLLLADQTAEPASAQTLTQNVELQFGTLQLPQAGSQSFTVSYAGATSGTGTLLFGSAAAGNYTINRGGLSSGTITLDIQNVSSGNSAMTLGNFTGLWNRTTIASFPQSGLDAPAKNGTTLKLGATLTYSSVLSVGNFNPSFDIVLIQP